MIVHYKKCIINRFFHILLISKERFTDVVSILVRTSALFVAVGIVFVGGYILQTQNTKIDETYGQVDASASILMNEISKTSPDFLYHIIRTKDFEILQQYFLDIPGGNTFLSDLSQLKIIDELKVERIGNGLVISFLGSSTDVFHPYYGYIEEKNNKISKIDWGMSGAAEIQELLPSPQDGFMALRIKNMGPYPWLENELWINKADMNEVVLLADEETQVVLPGQSGIIVLQENDGLLLSNTEHGYDVIVQE